MTQEELEEAIKGRWEDGWEALHPPDPDDPDHVPYTYDNESFEASDAWVRVTVVPTVRVRTTQGQASAKYDARGVIMVQVFGPADEGGARTAQLADDAIAVLEEARFGTPALIVTHEGSMRPGDSDARWAMRVVSVPYVLEQQR